MSPPPQKKRMNPYPTVITMGQGQAGKTTGLLALIGSNDTPEMTALNVFTIYFFEDGTALKEPEDKAKKDIDKIVRVTDTAGQEDYSQMRTVAYKSGVDAILFFVDMSISIDLEKAQSGEKVSDNCFENFFQELKTIPNLQEAELIFLLNKHDAIHETNKQNRDQIENLLRDTFGARVLGVFDTVCNQPKLDPETFKKINILLLESTEKARVKIAEAKKRSQKKFLCF